MVAGSGGCGVRRGGKLGGSLWTGPPPEELEDRRFGDFDVQVRRRPLPLRPYLYREVLSGPGGAVLTEHLARAPGSPVPPATATDLRVREHVLDDVIVPGRSAPSGGSRRASEA
jgi:hypothetical protein